jgi:Sec-independent protein secretion pathway component TatC
VENQALPIRFTEQYFAYASGLSTPEGIRQAKLSLYFGVIGLFIMGIFLGFLAVLYAHRAEKIGTRATAGKVLGYLDIVLGIGFSFLILTFFTPLI